MQILEKMCKENLLLYIKKGWLPIHSWGMTHRLIKASKWVEGEEVLHQRDREKRKREPVSSHPRGVPISGGIQVPHCKRQDGGGTEVEDGEKAWKGRKQRLHTFRRLKACSCDENVQLETLHLPQWVAEWVLEATRLPSFWQASHGTWRTLSDTWPHSIECQN